MVDGAVPSSGPTTAYALLQATRMKVDHIKHAGCPLSDLLITGLPMAAVKSMRRGVHLMNE